jgi:hypothetical protein
VEVCLHLGLFKLCNSLEIDSARASRADMLKKYSARRRLKLYKLLYEGSRRGKQMMFDAWPKV